MSGDDDLAGDFRPAPWLPGGHLQTIVPAFLSAPEIPDGEHRLVPVAPGTQVRVEIARPAGSPRGTLLLIHGMGGSADSRYMRRTAREALDRGWVAARMNLRNCGGTIPLARTLFNAGQSEDAGAVLDDLHAAGFPEPFVAAGFSLGGNLLLRHAGLAGNGCRAAAIAAVNPPVDLDACVRAIERPSNRIYQAYFVRGLCRGLRKVRRIRGLPGPLPRFFHVRTVRRVDELYTAPDAGQPSAEAYYGWASAGPVLGRIHVPTLVLSAANDPMVPVSMFEPWRDAPSVRFVHPRSGGHVGYVGRGRPRYWAARAIVDFLERTPPDHSSGGASRALP